MIKKLGMSKCKPRSISLLVRTILSSNNGPEIEGEKIR